MPTRGLFSCLDRTVSSLWEKKKGSLIRFYSRLVVESQHLYRLPISCQVDRTVSCKDLQFAWALAEVSSNLPNEQCHTSSGLYSIKLYNALYMYMYIWICICIETCIHRRNIFNPFGSISPICITEVDSRRSKYTVSSRFCMAVEVNFQELDELSCLVQYLFDSLIAQRDRHRKNAWRKHVAMRRTFFFLAARQ